MWKKLEEMFKEYRYIERKRNDSVLVTIRTKMATFNDLIPEYWTKLKSASSYGSLQDITKNFNLQRNIDYVLCPDEKDSKKKSGKDGTGIFDKLKNMLKNINYNDILSSIKNMQSGGAGGRPMKFPYTYTAKIAQFPLKFYLQKQWIWKYYAVSLVACFPVFYYINGLANSPGNVAQWAEIRRKEAEQHH